MAPRIRGDIRIGTSGWSYGAWRGVFYPPDLAEDAWLAHYARRLRAVEINSTFYRLPAPATLERWRNAVPAGFLFSVKASRFITHMKKLKDPQASLALFLERIQLLGSTLGPVLFQLPPRWRVNLPRLAAFLEALPAGHRYAFEFRDPSWWTDAVHDLLARHGAALCIHDLDGVQSPEVVTGRLVYVRLHGPDGPYQGSYDQAALAHWAERAQAWADQGRDVHCYFDNDQQGYAVENALGMQAMLASLL